MALGGIIVWALDLQSRSSWFDFWSGCSQVVTAWMADCQQTGKTSRYIINININSAFHPFGIGKSSTALSVTG